MQSTQELEFLSPKVAFQASDNTENEAQKSGFHTNKCAQLNFDQIHS